MTEYTSDKAHLYDGECDRCGVYEQAPRLINGERQSLMQGLGWATVRISPPKPSEWRSMSVCARCAGEIVKREPDF